MWYVAASPANDGGHRHVLCTATSEDGLHWVKPELDLCRDAIGEPSNVLFAVDHKVDGPTVLHDPDDGEHPWKTVLYQHGHVFVGRSRDGVHWSIPTDPKDAILPGFGDRTTALLDSEAPERYVILSRNRKDMAERQGVRCVYRVGSREARTLSSEPTLALRPDLEDGPYVEFYQMSAFRYESLYLGFIERYHTGEPPFADVELTVSRDTKSWHRVRPRTAFFAPPPNGREHGAFDYAVCTPANSPPFLHDGAIWIYYYGGPSFHGDRFMTHARQVGLAKLRPDGFVSVRAGRREGILETKPFRWPGGKLQVNSRVLGGNLWGYDSLAGADGYVLTEILDTGGNVIPGHSREDSTPQYRDATDWEPTWRDEPQDLDALIGKQIALRFILREAEIYSFRAAC